MKIRPLVPATLALAAGILFATLGNGPLWILLASFCFCGSVAILTRRARWGMATLLLFCAVLGCLRFRIASTLSSSDVSLLAPALIQVTGVVDSEVELHSSISTVTSEPFETAHFVLRARWTEPIGERALGPSKSTPVVGEVEVRVPLPRSKQEKGVTQKSENSDALRYGDLITVFGRLEAPSGLRNPGGFDDRAALARRNIHATLTAHLPQDWRLLAHSDPQSSAFLRLADSVKQRVLNHDHRALPPVRAATLDAILMGEKEALSPEVQDAFAHAGVSHLLATAGLHVGLVIALLLLLLPLLRIAQRPAILITLAGLAFYTAMAGGRPSILRAAIMAGIYLIGVLLEREPDLPNALSLAVLGLLLANPYNLFEPGFQLSFATVLTLILGMPLTLPWQRRLVARITGDGPDRKAIRFLLKYGSSCLLLSLFAQLGSLPLVAYYFSTVSPLSPLANTLLVPVIAPIIALGFAAALLGMLSPALALPLDTLLNGLIAYVLKVVQTCSALPFAVISVAPPPTLLIVLYYILMWLGLRQLRKPIEHRRPENSDDGVQRR